MLAAHIFISLFEFVIFSLVMDGLPITNFNRTPTLLYNRLHFLDNA